MSEKRAYRVEVAGWDPHRVFIIGARDPAAAATRVQRHVDDRDAEIMSVVRLQGEYISEAPR